MTGILALWVIAITWRFICKIDLKFELPILQQS